MQGNWFLSWKCNVWRVKESQFIVSHIKPHKPVSPSRVSRWLGQVLAMTGINTEGFKAHLTRSLSSSKAEITGVYLTDIIKQGNWSQTSTFQRFYRKSIKEYNSNFQSGILNKQLWTEEVFSFKPTTVENVKKLLNDIDTKKVVGIDTIPRKLIKIASNFLAPILTTAINSSTENSVFPEKCKSCYCCSIR